MEVAEEQYPGDEHPQKEFNTPEQTLRRSTIVRRNPPCLENLATVVIEDLVMMEEDMKSSNKEQWLKAMREELKFAEDNGTWARTALSLGKTAISCKMMLKKKLDEKGNCQIQPYLTVQFARIMEDGYL